MPKVMPKLGSQTNTIRFVRLHHRSLFSYKNRKKLEFFENRKKLKENMEIVQFGLTGFPQLHLFGHLCRSSLMRLWYHSSSSTAHEKRKYNISTFLTPQRKIKKYGKTFSKKRSMYFTKKYIMCHVVCGQYIIMCHVQACQCRKKGIFQNKDRQINLYLY